MSITKDHTITLTGMTCPVCGVVYGLSDVTRRSKREHGGSWFCTNGHELCYDDAIKSEKERLQSELKTAQNSSNYFQRQSAQNYDEVERQKRKVRAHKGAATKVRKRISHGVCPCCTRTFVNLERHITSKHPEYRESAEE